MIYILDENKNPVEVSYDDPRYLDFVGKENFEKNKRVAKTTIELPSGPVDISTVFLGIDHNWGDGPPILFETMVFGGPLDEYMERYHTWEEAELGHKRWVKIIIHLKTLGED